MARTSVWASSWGNYGTSPNSNYEIHDNGQMRIWWNNGQRNKFGTIDLRDDEWHHLVYIRATGPDLLRMYVDTNPDGYHPGAGSDIVFDDLHRIGADNRGSSNPNFHGAIDDLMIFNRALTPEDISALYDME